MLRQAPSSGQLRQAESAPPIRNVYSSGGGNGGNGGVGGGGRGGDGTEGGVGGDGGDGGDGAAAEREFETAGKAEWVGGQQLLKKQS